MASHLCLYKPCLVGILCKVENISTILRNSVINVGVIRLKKILLMAMINSHYFCFVHIIVLIV